MTGHAYMALHKAAIRSRMSLSCERVLMGIAAHATVDGRCRRSGRTLALYCGISRNTVIASLQWLEENGVISVKHCFKSASSYLILPPHKWFSSGSNHKPDLAENLAQ